VGGLCAGARLAGLGWKVTLVERLQRVGGRWSTLDIDGFKIPTGAFLIAADDPLAHTFTELDIDFEVRLLPARTAYLVEGELVETGDRGGLRALISTASRHDGSDAEAVMAAIKGALAEGISQGEQSLPEWLARAGAGPSVIAAVHALTQSFMALNAEEVQAAAFFAYLVATAGRGRHGIPPHGSRHLAEALAEYITDHGGEVITGSPVAQFLVEGESVSGVTLRDGGRIEADVLVSGLGIRETARLLPSHLADSLPGLDTIRAAPGMTVFVASQEPFFDHPAVVVTGTRCVCLVTTPTLVAPELAPRGWHYTELISTFPSSADDSNPKQQRVRHMADVDDLLPGWEEKGRLLHSATYRGAWPVYRAWPGEDPQERFPLRGLALVGDAVKPGGWPGTGASAEGARLVVEGITEGRHRLAAS
jgi:phytoene dehydrogenase-like protein